MATWKKIIVSGSDAHLKTGNFSSHVSASGNISGSVTSTGSFGRVEATTLAGDGSGITNLTAAAISSYTNASNNRIVTSVNSTTVNSEENLEFDGTDFLIKAGGKVAFRDVGDEYIYSVSDGTLGITAGTEIDLTATTVDLNGNLDVSGNVTSSYISASNDIEAQGQILAQGNVIGANISSSGNITGSDIFASSGLYGTLQTAAQTNITSVGALDAGSITSNFGTINNGASAITTTGLISGGSLDISLNNGSWLYYALGKIKEVTHNATDTAISSNSTTVTAGDDSTRFLRVIGGNEYPPILDTDPLKDIGTDAIQYTFEELNGHDLPSFSLDVSYNKASNTNRYVNTTTGTDMFSRIFTGCQVNTMTLNFEEGQELKTSLDLVTRRAFDAPVDYAPHRQLEGATGLYNYDATTTSPYMFSDGAITLFGQTYARVKGGSLTINNNITQQRFIGNTTRDIMSAHVPAQRTYDLTLTLLITDTAIWRELREQEEYDTDAGTIKLRYEKSSDDFIEIELDDYMISGVTIPFPDDKGPIEVEATINARTLTSCKYTGKWVILNDD